MATEDVEGALNKPGSTSTCPTCGGSGYTCSTYWRPYHRKSCKCSDCHGTGLVSAIPDCTCNAPSGNAAWHHEWNCARLKAMPAPDTQPVPRCETCNCHNPVMSGAGCVHCRDTQPCANCAQLEKAHPTPYCKRFRLPDTQPGDELSTTVELIYRDMLSREDAYRTLENLVARTRQAAHDAAYTQGRRDELQSLFPFMTDHSKCIDRFTCLGYMNAVSDYEDERFKRLAALQEKPKDES